MLNGEIEMNTYKVNVLICLLLLVAVVAGGSACSVTRTSAHSPEETRTEAMRRESDEPSAPAYKPPKRVSKDVIKTDKKVEEKMMPKQKAKK